MPATRSAAGGAPHAIPQAAPHRRAGSRRPPGRRCGGSGAGPKGTAHACAPSLGQRGAGPAARPDQGAAARRRRRRARAGPREGEGSMAAAKRGRGSGAGALAEAAPGREEAALERDRDHAGPLSRAPAVEREPGRRGAVGAGWNRAGTAAAAMPDGTGAGSGTARPPPSRPGFAGARGDGSGTARPGPARPAFAARRRCGIGAKAGGQGRSAGFGRLRRQRSEQ